MSEDELTEFKEQLKVDPDLMAELDIHRLTDEVSQPAEEERFRKKLATAYDEYENRKSDSSLNKIPSQNNKLFIGAVSAAAAIIIILLIILQPFTLTQDEIFIKYYEPFTGDFSSRSVIDEQNNYPVKAIKFYIDEDYKASFDELTTFISRENNTVITNFYLGLAAIENKEYALAIKSFQDVLREDFSFLHEHAKWYLSLTFLKVGKPDLAEEILLDLELQESIYSKKSKNILQKID